MKKLLIDYNLDATEIEKLEGYVSINYRIKTKSNQFVLKHYLNASEYGLVKAEVQLIDEISNQLSFEIPTTVKPLTTLKDNSFTRLLTYIEGDFLAKAEQNKDLLFNFGKSIAQLDKHLLSKRSYPIEARKQVWDLQYCLLNKVKINHIKDASKRKLVHYFFDQFEHHVLPKQDLLRYAIIHGDLNENNVLVEKNEIVGFIDFGDICYSPLINEIAIAITYIMLLNTKDPIKKACEVLKGYHSVIPLLEEEIGLLYYLIAARLCVSVCNSSEAMAKGGQTDYILINRKPTWKLLEQFISFNPIGMTNQFLNALGIDLKKEDSTKLLSKRKKYTAQSLSLSYDTPIHMTGAAFQYMYDSNGNSYLDAYNNIPLVGHCHPKISQVISEKVRKLNTNTRYLYEEFTEYAEKLLTYFPTNLNKVFFVNSGSAATDLALRMARNFKQRSSIAILEHGYHGNTQMGIDVSAYKFDGKGGKGVSKNTIKLPLPNVYKGNYDSGKAYAEDAIERLQTSINKGLIPAAFLAEPISGCGGQVPIAPEYLKILKPFLVKHGILMISDEVQTGFGRLGSHFWGFEMHDVIPDIVILGKPIGNTHPIGAVVTTEKIADSFSNGMEFFSSFGGNPVSCAIGSKVLDILEEEKLQENALVVGNYYKSELKKLQSEFSSIGDVRGQGLFLGIEFIDNKGQPDTKIAQQLKNQLKENFILVSTDGPHDNVIKTKPPLCFTKENVDQVLYHFREILKRT
jgi:4-aminobutyrate aminotransferase-like enzyme/Ser/Thr protein kinase RdoA (MazF antagonist)